MRVLPTRAPTEAHACSSPCTTSSACVRPISLVRFGFFFSNCLWGGGGDKVNVNSETVLLYVRVEDWFFVCLYKCRFVLPHSLSLPYPILSQPQPLNFFSGELCQIADPCNAMPCQNGGKCVLEAAGQFRCDCPTGLAGDRCDRDVDECAMNPCKHGHCFNAFGSYR